MARDRRKYYEMNKERLLERSRAYSARCREADPEGWRQLQRGRMARFKARHPNRLAEAVQKYRETHTDEVRLRLRERLRRRKADLVERLRGKCQDCGIKGHPAIYDFDHRDPATKVKGLSDMLTWRLERILPELEKCDLVCRNCHAIRTINSEAVYAKMMAGVRRRRMAALRA